MKHLDDLTETLNKLKRQDMLKKLSLSSPIAETEKSTEPREPLLSPTLASAVYNWTAGILLLTHQFLMEEIIQLWKELKETQSSCVISERDGR